MAPKKSSKKLGKKDLRKTKGGILVGLNQPTLTDPGYKPIPAWKLEPSRLRSEDFPRP